MDWISNPGAKSVKNFTSVGFKCLTGFFFWLFMNLFLSDVFRYFPLILILYFIGVRYFTVYLNNFFKDLSLERKQVE